MHDARTNTLVKRLTGWAASTKTCFTITGDNSARTGEHDKRVSPPLHPSSATPQPPSHGSSNSLRADERKDQTRTNSIHSSNYFEGSQTQTIFAIENSSLVNHEIPNSLVISENINCDHGKRDPSDTPTPAIELEFDIGFITGFLDSRALVCFVRP